MASSTSQSLFLICSGKITPEITFETATVGIPPNNPDWETWRDSTLSPFLADLRKTFERQRNYVFKNTRFNCTYHPELTGLGPIKTMMNGVTIQHVYDYAKSRNMISAGMNTAWTSPERLIARQSDDEANNDVPVVSIICPSEILTDPSIASQGKLRLMDGEYSTHPAFKGWSEDNFTALSNKIRQRVEQDEWKVTRHTYESLGARTAMCIGVAIEATQKVLDEYGLTGQNVLATYIPFEDRSQYT